MNIIEQATKRLEELARSGVEVPWAAAGLAGGALQGRAAPAARPAEPTIDAAMRRLGQQQAPKSGAAPPTRVPAEAPARNGNRDAAAEAVTIDLHALQQSGHLAATNSRSLAAEEFRKIKRPLLRNARAPDATGRHQALILVTSALPSEGKTFVATNLAMSMAMEIDTSVLLVDADVVRPDVLTRLGLAPRKGLLDLLTDDTLDIADVLLRTNIPKLSILPAGAPDPRSTELLASDAMARLLTELATRYPDRIVVLDAPPLLVTNEASVLASRVGQVVMVIEASRTPREAVAQAFAAIEACPVVMSVLNRGTEPQSHAYADYYG